MTTVSKHQTLPAGRHAGVCLHLTSLPGSNGIGEIGQRAIDFVDAMKQMQLSVWQFLPTGPTAYGDSPYQALSTFAGNELLIDVADLVTRGLLMSPEVAELESLPKQFVDYAALIPLKNGLLQRAAQRFADRAPSAERSRYEDFLGKHDAAWLHDYALFRVLKSRHKARPWPDWQAEFVHRDRCALGRLESAAAAEIEAVKIIQFLFHEQWGRLKDHARANGIRLFGDMPIYIALDSADAWANRELLQVDSDGRPAYVAGVPPDYFSEDGQLWGNPLYAWDVHAATGYRWWIDRIRASSELVDIVRIDHFRGFEAYWAVLADSTTARVGAWEPGPGDAIFEAMRKALGDLPIVAENLGVITPEVEAMRNRHQIPGMVVLQFAVCDADFSLSAIAENCVCYTGTHDNDTTIGWFHGGPQDIRTKKEIRDTQEAVLAITAGTPETIHSDLIKAAFSTAARLTIAPMQDYLGLGSEARFNTPGTSSNNWRWRLLESQLTGKFCNVVAEMVGTAGRGTAS